MHHINKEKRKQLQSKKLLIAVWTHGKCCWRVTRGTINKYRELEWERLIHSWSPWTKKTGIYVGGGWGGWWGWGDWWYRSQKQMHSSEEKELNQGGPNCTKQCAGYFKGSHSRYLLQLPPSAEHAWHVAFGFPAPTSDSGGSCDIAQALWQHRGALISQRTILPFYAKQMFQTNEIRLRFYNGYHPCSPDFGSHFALFLLEWLNPTYYQASKKHWELSSGSFYICLQLPRQQKGTIIVWIKVSQCWYLPKCNFLARCRVDCAA